MILTYTVGRDPHGYLQFTDDRYGEKWGSLHLSFLDVDAGVDRMVRATDFALGTRLEFTRGDDGTYGWHWRILNIFPDIDYGDDT